MMGSLKTVPSNIDLMIPLGDFHIFFNLNSSTLASSGVIVAHLTPTLCFSIALAESIVTYLLSGKRTYLIISLISIFN